MVRLEYEGCGSISSGILHDRLVADPDEQPADRGSIGKSASTGTLVDLCRFTVDQANSYTLKLRK